MLIIVVLYLILYTIDYQLQLWEETETEDYILYPLALAQFILEAAFLAVIQMEATLITAHTTAMFGIDSVTFLWGMLALLLSLGFLFILAVAMGLKTITKKEKDEKSMV